MGKRKTDRNLRRAAAFVIAVLLWAEGTLGSVCAAPETMSGNTVVTVPEGGEEALPEETEKPVEGEEALPEETEKPEGGEEALPEETEKPVEGEEALPEETEKPGEGEEALPEEAEKPAEDEESVSENTPDAEEELLPEQIPGAEEILGEPPLSAQSGDRMGTQSYNNRVMSTETGGISLQTPGQADIIARYKAYPWKLDVANTYSDKPSTKKPYKAGYLSDASLNNALYLLNFIRYVAGIPADVALNENYTELAQTGALLNCVNNKLSHEPKRPDGWTSEEPEEMEMLDDLYQKGYEGCSNSNIAYNYGNIAQTLLKGWMFDGDASNIGKMGHRRWALNPSMVETGFGAVGAYSAMYAVDRRGSEITDYVAWPAKNMPIELMNGSGTPWTLSLGSNYKTAEQEQVTVTLKNVSSGKTWTFSDKKKDGYFAVNTGGFGMTNCIIFRPSSVSYGKTSQFQVTVTGLKDQSGQETTLRYTVDFFSLSDTPREVQRVTLNQTKLHLLLADTEGKEQGALHAALTPSNAADKTLEWSSLHPAVATVEADRVITADSTVTAKGVGETTIMVTAANGQQAACEVKVSKYALSADGIAYDKETDTYSLAFEIQGDDLQGAAKQLTIRDGDALCTDTVRWTSENGNVAAVDADGIVTPVGVGEATIWANVESGLKILACEVKVENAQLPVMQMRESSFTMNKQEERQLRVYLSPVGTKWENSEEKYIKWKVDKPEKAVFWHRQENGGMASAAELIGGNTVTVLALAAGTTTITAEIVDAEGNPVGSVDEERGKAECKVTVRRGVELPAEADELCFIALTNTQKTLEDIKLPDGWNWKYPDTSLTQFSGQRSKLFPAEYRPLDEINPSSGEVQPAETLLPVYFLTLESISMCVKHRDDANVLADVSVLKPGWVPHCYVNYSVEETLEQFEEKNAELENNTWYQNQKTELLKWLDKSITLTSSKPQILSVEPVKNAAGKTALSAKKIGSAVLKAELKLGKKTFRASQKLTVAEQVGAAFEVKWLDIFGKIEGEDPYRYAADLSDFPMSAKGGINSKIRLEMTGVTKLTVKSSNSKVIALKSSTVKPTETVQFEFPLMVKAAGTAQITVTGNDAAKTSRTLTLMVADDRPSLSEETVTVNTWRTAGTDFCLYAGKDETGAFYEITDVFLEDAETGGKHSGKFTLKRSEETVPDGSRWNGSITAKADTKKGTYKMRLYVRVGDKAYYLPFTAKVVSTKPKCSVKQKEKLNLFYQKTESLVILDTEEKIESVSLSGCSYLVELSNSMDGWYLRPTDSATINGTKKGTLKIQLEGWKLLELPFTVSVEKKAPKIAPVIGTATLYPKSGLTSARIGVKNAETLPWNQMTIENISVKAKGNYEAELLAKEQAVLLKGANLNQTDSFRATVKLRSSEWTDFASFTCNVKVNLKEPAIVLEKKTLQLNANDAYRGYDAASTVVRWKNGADVLSTQNVRMSVYSDPKDAKAKALAADSGVIFAIEKENDCYIIKARLNNKAVAKGNYKFTVQAAKDGKIWKTPLTLKVVNTAPDKAVKITAKGSIDVLNRTGSHMTLTPSLKALNGTFEIPKGREVKLTGRDAYLFRAVWSEDGKAIELYAKDKKTLVIKHQYTVTPVLTLRNVNGMTEELLTAPVKFMVKQGSVKVSALPKTVVMHSSAYNSVTIDMKAVLKGAAEPEMEKVILAGNTDAFTYVYNKDGKGTLTMRDTGRAVKGKSYTLQFQVFFAERADNVKPVTVRYTVKIK